MKFYRLSDATLYDRINTIYQSIKPFLDKKCLFLRNMKFFTLKVLITTEADNIFILILYFSEKIKQFTWI